MMVEVAVSDTRYHFDKTYTYAVPELLRESACPGCRVEVPFGRGNGVRTGMIMAYAQAPAESKIKPLAAVLDQAPLLSHEMLQLADWIKGRYFCTLYDAIRLFLPVGLRMKTQIKYKLAADGLPPETKEATRIVSALQSRRGPAKRDFLLRTAAVTPEKLEEFVQAGWLLESVEATRRVADATQKMVRAVVDAPQVTLTKKQEKAYELLLAAGEVAQRELCDYIGVTAAVVDALVKKGVATYFQAEVYRNPYPLGAEKPLRKEILLSAAQQQAFLSIREQIAEKAGKTVLLSGVTGSGKTSVYMRLIDEVYDAGRGIIVMVPEISLTPQTVALFHERYGNAVAVFHSGLSLGERLDEWKRVKNQDARIVVGTRSAVFAPFENLGLIVMDEEQEYTYKSESVPRYHARDVARFRTMYHGAVLLLASATPSVESRHAAEKGRYGFCDLPDRYGGAVLPEVTVVDMNQERLAGNASIYSTPLLENLRENLAQGRQSILLLNRRGYHTFARCRSCGEVVYCPHCSISLTYHAVNEKLICHYCGYATPVTGECPSCHAHEIGYLGFGTQRAVEELATLCEEARILRLDTDAATSRLVYEEKMRQFGRGDYDVLVGTQMVAKGLDFENVTLVGVLSADQALYSEDFRSAERAFDLLTQVVGRAGRGRHVGRAMIQTFTPEHPVIALAARQDYESFYRDEIEFRRAMLYPPFVDFCVMGFIGEEETAVSRAASAYLELLREVARQDYPALPMRVLNPSPAAVMKVSNRYRYRLIIKCRNNAPFRELTARLLKEFVKRREFAKVTIYVDINPDIVL